MYEQSREIADIWSTHISLTLNLSN